MLKHLIIIILLLCGSGVRGQVTEPAMLWLKVIRGERSYKFPTAVTATPDGGFTVSIQSASATTSRHPHHHKRQSGW
ncbi:MAG: hypothetical protein H7257_10380 [Taibaiella sp.]|nr:hypothetical protein [Taibaiella sp.]